MASLASGVGITVSNANPDGEKDSQASLVRSQETRGYGTVRKDRRSSNGYHVHEIKEGDTLQGIALKYAVPIGEIQRTNRISGSTIHLLTELKIPIPATSSPQPSPNSSPSSSRRQQKMNGDSNQRRISSSEEHAQSQLTTKTGSTLSGSRLSDRMPVESSMEKSIAGLLNSTDEQLRKAREFNEKMAQKIAATKLPPGAYNRGVPQPLTPSDTRPQARYERRNTTASPQNDITLPNQEKVENEIFEL